MTKITGKYQGDLDCTLSHAPSGTLIYTDAPADIGGKVRAFSPTDLIGAALGSCIATTLGLYAKRKGWDLTAMRFEVTKEMMSPPERRISHLHVHFWMPIHLSADERKSCERVAGACPVHKSLHPGIEISLIFHWPE